MIRYRTQKRGEGDGEMVEICIDTETTGLTPEDNRILQLACSSGGQKFCCFIKHKDNKITANTRKFHPKEFLEKWEREAVSEEEFGVRFKAYLNSLGVVKKKEVVFVAHNAEFDEGFCTLSWEDDRVKEFFNTQWKCSLKLARKLLPKLKSRKLGEIAKMMNVKVAGNLHEADTDTNVLEEVWEVLKVFEARQKSK